MLIDYFFVHSVVKKIMIARLYVAFAAVDSLVQDMIYIGQGCDFHLKIAKHKLIICILMFIK